MLYVHCISIKQGLGEENNDKCCSSEVREFGIDWSEVGGPGRLCQGGLDHFLKYHLDPLSSQTHSLSPLSA